jgi:hypothetical protein
MPDYQGGFKFQVQRVNDGAVAHRPPTGWQNRDIPWAGVEPRRKRVQLSLGVAGQAGSFGQVLTQQAMGMLIAPTLPEAVRIGKENLDGQTVRQPLMFHHLFAPIVGQRVPQRSRDTSELPGEVRTGGLRAVHAGQQTQPRRPFHQSAHSRAIASTFQYVAFPLARPGPGGNLGGSFGARGHSGNLAPAVSASRPWATGLARLPQDGQQSVRASNPQPTVW